MCGRYVITSPPEALRAFLRFAELPNFPPRYNIAPTQPVPIVRLAHEKAHTAAQSDASAFAVAARHLALVRWGLIASWVADPRKFPLLINARAESVIEKPAFRAAMRRRRCLFPTDGFYEWRADGARKVPFHIRRRGGGPMAFAGLWETWMGPNGEEVESAAIVTIEANRALRPIHARMPVILEPDAFDAWLDCASVEAGVAAALLVPAREDLLEAYPVSAAVNRTANDDAALLQPLAENADPAPPRKQPKRRARGDDGGQSSLF